MPEIRIEKPEDLLLALDRMRPESLMTIALFLLAAGVWQSRSEDIDDILPDRDMEVLGLNRWRVMEWTPSEQFGLPDERPSAEQLPDAIYRAYQSRASRDLAWAVLCGLDHPDDLVRACALRSAVEMFRHPDPYVYRYLRAGFSPENRMAYTIASIATSTNAPGTSLSLPVQGAAGLSGKPQCVALVHGTNFPPRRPVWSMPMTGPLFVHVQGIRPDIYDRPDYFRWEGGYSDYAREVAAYNMNDWVARRGLHGLDMVAHSHGCNVLMASTHLGVRFDRAVLLSCPVHWKKYYPAAGSIAIAQSIRVHLDKVILADRGGQSFPAGTIPEDVLPIWFDHGATTDPGVWLLRNLDRYLI